jgi:hypothetical protein
MPLIYSSVKNVDEDVVLGAFGGREWPLCGDIADFRPGRVCRRRGAACGPISSNFDCLENLVYIFDV